MAALFATARVLAGMVAAGRACCEAVPLVVLVPTCRSQAEALKQHVLEQLNAAAGTGPLAERWPAASVLVLLPPSTLAEEQAEFAAAPRVSLVLASKDRLQEHLADDASEAQARLEFADIVLLEDLASQAGVELPPPLEPEPAPVACVEAGHAEAPPAASAAAPASSPVAEPSAPCPAAAAGAAADAGGDAGAASAAAVTTLSEAQLVELHGRSPALSAAWVAQMADAVSAVHDDPASVNLGAGKFGSVAMAALPCPPLLQAAVDRVYPDGLAAGGLPVVIKKVTHAASSSHRSGMQAPASEAWCAQACGGHPAVSQLLHAQHDPSKGVSFLVFAATTAEPQNLLHVLRCAFVNRMEALPLTFTVNVLRDVAAALEHCHSRGIIHSDIKPDNIVVRGAGGCSLAERLGVRFGEGTAFLADFGLCSPMTSVDQHHGGGTIWYKDPQLIAARNDPQRASTTMVTPQADVYAVGMSLVVMLTLAEEGLVQRAVGAAARGGQAAAGGVPAAEAFGDLRQLLLARKPRTAPELLDLMVSCLDCQARRPKDGAELVRLVDALERRLGLEAGCPGLAEEPQVVALPPAANAPGSAGAADCLGRLPSELLSLPSLSVLPALPPPQRRQQPLGAQVVRQRRRLQQLIVQRQQRRPRKQHFVRRCLAAQRLAHQRTPPRGPSAHCGPQLAAAGGEGAGGHPAVAEGGPAVATGAPLPANSAPVSMPLESCGQAVPEGQDWRAGRQPPDQLLAAGQQQLKPAAAALEAVLVLAGLEEDEASLVESEGASPASSRLHEKLACAPPPERPLSWVRGAARRTARLAASVLFGGCGRPRVCYE